MSELRPFHTIDPDDLAEPEEQREAAEFLQKLDHEGGIAGLLGYGGCGAFPAKLHGKADAADKAIEELRAAIQEWANERGVSY